MAGTERIWWRYVLAVWLVGLGVRLAFVVFVTRHHAPSGDQVYYSSQAVANAQGNWYHQPFVPGMPSAEHPPLTSFVLTPITWLTESTGQFVTAQRLTMALIGSLAIVLMAVLGRRIAGDVAGVVAAGITALYANVWMNDGLLMSEGLAFLLVAGLTVVAIDFARGPTLRRSVAMGMLAALAALTRPELVVLVVLVGLVLPLLVMRRNEEPAVRPGVLVAGALAASLIVLAPWVAWNQVRFEDRVLLSTNDGLTIAGANCDSTYFGGDLGGWDIWCAYAVPRPDGLDASQESTLMREAGLRYWRDHLDRYPAVALARVARVTSTGWLAETVEAGRSEGRPGAVSWLGIVQWWLLVPLAIAGWRLVPSRAERWLLVVLAPLVVVVAALANAYVRFRVPAEVGIIVLAATAVAYWGERRAWALERSALE